MEGLTAGFGMGPGVSPPLLPPETCNKNALAYYWLISLTPYSITSHDFGLDLDGERMKHVGGGSEGVYVIRRGGSDECFAVIRQR